MKTISKRWLTGAVLVALTACGAGDQAPDPAPKLRQGAVAATAGSIDYSTVLQQIYVGYFGRPADPAGLAYYADALRAAGAPSTLPEMSKAYYTNAGLKALIDGFGESQESRDLYPGDDGSFVTAIYFNLFNRAPDSAGKAYWVGLIGSGAMTRANAALSIMAGSLKGDLVSIENKAAAASAFTVALDSPARLRGYNGATANETARAMLRQVGQDTRADAFQSSIDTAVKGMAGAAALPVMLAAANHSMALKPDGSLWIWGNNYDGELGNPEFASKSDPYKLGDGYVGIESGFNHSFALKADGSLYGWGWNLLGQLGDGTLDKVTLPKKVGSGYATVSASYGHTLAIKFDRSLWAWGWNVNGQLGNGSNAKSSVPVRIGDGFTAVAAGFSHSLALKTDGSLWAWGSGNAGQQGDGTYSDNTAPHQVGTGFVAISAGTDFSMGLKADGTLWAWGLNNKGQLGDGTLENRNRPVLIGSGYSTVSAGARHTLALKTDGSLFSWGSNEDGQLGDSSLSIGKTPSLVGTRYVAIAAGEHHSLGTKADGSLWSWGLNDYGQLGNGRVTPEALPTQAAASVGEATPPGPTVPTTPSGKAAVTSVTPLTVVDGQETSFVVRGTNLSDDLKFSIEGCMTGFGNATGSGTERTFVCTPGVVGSRTGTIKSAASGETLFNFSVTVGGRPAFLSFIPLTATVNQLTTFTFGGVYLQDGMVFSLDGCTGVVEVLGGTANFRQYRCTPTSAGEKSGGLKTANGTSVGKINVTIGAAASNPDPQPKPVSTISGVVSIAPVSGATVSVYAVSGGAKGSLLGTVTTNSSGEYTLQLGSYTGLVLIEAQGGRYTDPATGVGTTLSLIRSVVTVANGNNVANLTPYTEPVVANASKLGGGLSSANVASTLQTVKTQLGFDPVATKPADPNQVASPSTSASSITYSGLLGVASQYAGDNQEKTMVAIQEDLSTLLAALAKVNPMIAQSADNYWANSRNVMGLSSNLGSGNHFTICYTGPYTYGIAMTTCTKSKPVITCPTGKSAKDGVCVKTTTTTPTPSNPGQGNFVSTQGGTGSDAAQCVKIEFRAKNEKKGYYYNQQIMTNTCGVKIAIATCHSPSSEIGTSGSVCRADGAKFYPNTFWLDPGEVDDNRFKFPQNATIYYGACSGGKGSDPSIRQVGSNGDYWCY